jgi:hypothetical protein
MVYSQIGAEIMGLFFNKGIKLKDGSRAKDPRLGRIVEVDEQSKLFAIRADVINLTPVSRSWRCDTYLDQGNAGSCVGNAMAHQLAASPDIYTGLDETFAVGLYYLAQQLDQWPGGAYPGASPQYEGSSTLAGMKALQKHGYIKNYKWAFSLADAVLAIGHHSPVVIGINWYNDMFTPDSKGFLHPSGGVAGGHDILVRAVKIIFKDPAGPKTMANVDPNKSFVTLHNSWGKGWGINGEAYLTLTDFEKLITEDGADCALPVGQVAQKYVKGATMHLGKSRKG